MVGSPGRIAERGSARINPMLYRAFLSLFGSLLLLASVLLWNRHALSAPCVKNMDRAYTHLSVEIAKRGEAFEGAFSHAGFRHPGPALFYYLAGAGLVLSPFMSNEDSYRVAVLALNCAALGLAAFLLAGLTAHRTYALLLPALAFVVITPRTLFDYWNPCPVPALACAYLLALVYLAHARFWFLPLACLLGGFTAHCHISTPPFLTATLLYALGAAILRRRGESGTRSAVALPLVASVAVSLVMWWGPLSDWWRFGSESNLGVIARSFLEEHRTASLNRAFWAVWHLAAKRLNIFFGLPEDASNFLPLVLVGLVAVTTPKRGAFFHLRLLLLVSWIVTVLALSRSFQPLADYLISYFLAPIVLALFLAVVAIVEWVAKILSPRVGLAAGRCRLSACGIALVLVLASAIRHPDPGASHKRDSCSLMRFADRFVTALDPKPGATYAITPTTLELRGFTVFFALSMLEHGAQFCFDDQWEHYVGRALTCSYRLREGSPAEAVQVEVALIGDPPAPRKQRPRGSPLRRRQVQMNWIDAQGRARSLELSGRAGNS